MARLLMRDVSRAGHELGRARLDDLPPRLTLGDLLRHRVQADVAAYNADPGPVFAGLVQPPDAIRHSDGFHMRSRRRLDPQPLLAAAEEAVTTGMLRLRVGPTTLERLDDEVVAEEHEEVTAVLERSIVARGA